MRRSSDLRLSVALLFLFSIVVISIPAANASVYPGRNGYITYVHSDVFLDISANIHRQFRDGTRDQQLTVDGTSKSPTWSPKGDRIAYVTAGQLAIMNADGTGKRMLGLFGSSPTWSPDGKKIAFNSNGRLKTATPSGTAVRNLTAIPSRATVSYSPINNNMILVARSSFSPSSDAQFTYTVSKKKKTPIKMTEVSASDVIDSVGWMPSGTGLVFIATCDARGVCNDARNVYVAPVAGGPRTQMTHRSDFDYCDIDGRCAYLTGVAAGPNGQDFLVEEEMLSGAGAQCVYAIVAKANVCDGNTESVSLGDWQALKR